MKIDDLNELPDWEEDPSDEEDNEGEQWKLNITRELCKEMYEQWNKVMTVLKASFDSLHQPGADSFYTQDRLDYHVDMVLSMAYEVAVKIRSSEVGLYVIRMENATIIRKNAEYIKIHPNTFVSEGLMEVEHKIMIQNEIDAFREIFKKWVATFKKDEFEDEWGLFL